MPKGHFQDQVAACPEHYLFGLLDKPVDLLILVGVDMEQPAVCFVTHVAAVKLLIAALHHGQTKARVTSELMFCKR